ncbi:nuclear transport factor 2 family protein [Bradyrhizobium sp. LHD-71]|uniref:nuclear transport factor 2 family protein n=1 Tax=Bradyrhizobium sp. LHD-71 TaxID=3072141 RepID=UPI00280D8D06|nr:nuclear transport factor 2 family protein [Bradyrhizobium sp. LHD-71]MDQ8729045.1 nuclear transport factor 2 family protein [Bradyrhizobium sp. LHD-71]
MSGHPLWTFTHALRKGLGSQSSAEIAPCLHEEVDWAIFGPIDMFPYLGARQGKEAALDSIARMADNFRLHKIKQEDVVLGDNSASALLRCSLNSNETNRPISVRLAAFLRFKDGKLASLRAVIDTFDLVEQALGRPIHLPAMV